MIRTIVVDSEYLSAADSYNDAARRVHEATEFFKRNVMKLITIKAIQGKTAQNMSLFMREMTSVLRATFKEQVSYAASLCSEYVQKIDKADRSMSFNTSTKGVQSMSFVKPVETPYTEGLITLNKTVIMQYVEQLKDGPVNDIESYIGCIERISFAESMGAVKDQNENVQGKTIESLRALMEIFNTFITTIESIVSAMQDTDASIANSISNNPFPPRFPNPPWVPEFPIK